MAKFKIIQSDPLRYKEQILKFWEKYLPGTPARRFDWMQSNPAGPAIWFFAFDEETLSLAGTISIMPKQMLLNKRDILIGIVGDYMISDQCRVFGPALQLQRAVTQNFSALRFEFIFTIPNQAAVKIMQRVGFVEKTKLFSLVKPIEILPYLKKRVKPAIAQLTAPFMTQAIKLFSKELYVSAQGVFEELPRADGSFDLLWQDFKANHTGLIGDHCSAYLTWKYFQNPIKKFRALTYRKNEGGNLLGYVFFSIDDGKMEIFDIITLHKDYANKLMKHIIRIARTENCRAIHIMISEDNPWHKMLKGYLFIDTKSNASIYCYGNSQLLSEKWHFFEGERNI